MTRELYDEGLQPERTELAWRRTALAFGVVSLLGFRLFSVAFGDSSWSLAVLVSIVVAGALWVAARRRSVLTSRALIADRPEELPGGGLMLVVTALAAAVALGAIGATLFLLLARLASN